MTSWLAQWRVWINETLYSYLLCNLTRNESGRTEFDFRHMSKKADGCHQYVQTASGHPTCRGLFGWKEGGNEGTRLYTGGGMICIKRVKSFVCSFSSCLILGVKIIYTVQPSPLPWNSLLRFSSEQGTPLCARDTLTCLLSFISGSWDERPFRHVLHVFKWVCSTGVFITSSHIWPIV
jgi:hypothetical protein